MEANRAKQIGPSKRQSESMPRSRNPCLMLQKSVILYSHIPVFKIKTPTSTGKMSLSNWTLIKKISIITTKITRATYSFTNLRMIHTSTPTLHQIVQTHLVQPSKIKTFFFTSRTTAPPLHQPWQPSHPWTVSTAQTSATQTCNHRWILEPCGPRRTGREPQRARDHKQIDPEPQQASRLSTFRFWAWARDRGVKIGEWSIF